MTTALLAPRPTDDSFDDSFQAGGLDDSQLAAFLDVQLVPADRPLATRQARRRHRLAALVVGCLLLVVGAAGLTLAPKGAAGAATSTTTPPAGVPFGLCP
jgi:hypothetical protein